MKPHYFSPEILKECDIRGILGKDLNVEDAYFVGRSFGTSLKRMKIHQCVVGWDGRISSPVLSIQVKKGLNDSGIDVIDIGLVPTPVVYFAVSTLFPGGGIVVTASHNPPEYNGFKFITDRGPFYAEGLRTLALISQKSDFEEGTGSVRIKNVIPEYIDHLAGFLQKPFQKTFSIVWDPGNGAAAVTLPSLLKFIPGKHNIICGEVDGTFPNHHPDPSKETNVKMLQKKVLKTGADFGISFDGDGDRIGVVDSEGYLFQGDQLLTLYARDFLKINPSEKIMSEVKASRFFYDEVTALGGKPIIWKVGHTHQKQKMIEQHIQLAGETSGHFYFNENNGHDDALFAAIKLINFLSSGKESLNEMRKKFPVYHDTGEIRIPLAEVERKRVVSEISRRLTDASRQFIGIDGIRTSCKDGFWLIRGSNTQPDLTIRCEAGGKEGFIECVADLQNQLSLSGITWKYPV